MKRNNVERKRKMQEETDTIHDEISRVKEDGLNEAYELYLLLKAPINSYTADKAIQLQREIGKSIRDLPGLVRRHERLLAYLESL